MRDLVFFLGRHLGERLRRSVRPEPRIPAEALGALRLDKNLAGALAEEDRRLAAVPVRDAALRLRGSIQQRVRDRAEALAAGRLEQPSDVRTGKASELVE